MLTFIPFWPWTRAQAEPSDSLDLKSLSQKAFAYPPVPKYDGPDLLNDPDLLDFCEKTVRVTVTMNHPFRE